MIKLKDIKYRVGTFKDKGKSGLPYATFLIYIDARTAMDELDEKYGDGWAFDWQRYEGTKWAVKGKMTIGDITRYDVGYPQDTKTRKGIDDSEWLKDAVSDALKRCAVQFGIGRILYDAPFLYSEEINTYRDKGGVIRINNYAPLNDTGEQLIKGKIEDWYKSLNINKTK